MSNVLIFMKPKKSFTIEYSNLVECIATKCGISEAFNPVYQPDVTPPEFVEFNALWDTGAMRSVISTEVVRILGLLPVGQAKVYHTNGVSVVKTYLIDILLPNAIEFSTVLVTEGILGDTDVLVGMDIISRGDFAVTGSNGKTKFSFQVPSTHDIDFSECN